MMAIATNPITTYCKEMYCVKIHTCENFGSKRRMQRKYKEVLDCQNKIGEIVSIFGFRRFLCIEFEYIVRISVSLLCEADACVWYPLLFVYSRINRTEIRKAQKY